MEKAFDSVNWRALMEIIDNINIGPNYKNWIQQIYTRQKARIRINGELTKPINIERGTRQGCPLSPLLFLLIMETLINKIKSSEEIQGVKIKQFDYKIRAFADDIVINLEDPQNNIGKLMEIIEEWGPPF